MALLPPDAIVLVAPEEAACELACSANSANCASETGGAVDARDDLWKALNSAALVTPGQFVMEVFAPDTAVMRPIGEVRFAPLPVPAF